MGLRESGKRGTDDMSAGDSFKSNSTEKGAKEWYNRR